MSGESATREVAAYLLDYKDHFCGVPATTFIEFYHPDFNFANDSSFNKNGEKQTKQGSFQVFVKHDDVVENFGSGIFPVKEVHKIAILDLRILNCDRNEMNILVRKVKKA